MLSKNFIFQVISVSHDVPNEIAVVYKALNFKIVEKTKNFRWLFAFQYYSSCQHSQIQRLWKANQAFFGSNEFSSKIISYRIISLPMSHCVNTKWLFVTITESTVTPIISSWYTARESSRSPKRLCVMNLLEINRQVSFTEKSHCTIHSSRSPKGNIIQLRSCCISLRSLWIAEKLLLSHYVLETFD